MNWISDLKGLDSKVQVFLGVVVVCVTAIGAVTSVAQDVFKQDKAADE